jgi:rhodanese-related sulfurtransferase
MPVLRISKDDLKQRLEGPVSDRPTVVDVRLKYPYEHSTVRLPGSLRMPPGALDRTQLPLDRDIVLYDSDPEELVAERVADELARLGYRAAVLAGGIAAWVNAKFPVETKPAPQTAAPDTLKA